MELPPSRRSIRYNGYNYSMAGYYAITVCSAAKAHLFGYLDEEQLVPSALGRLVQDELLRVPQQHPTVQVDEWTLMPNHLHFILVLRKNQAVALSAVVGAFKSRCYHTWRTQLLAQGLPAPASCWQRNYYEHIIRDAASLDGYRAYIRTNPSRW